MKDFYNLKSKQIQLESLREIKKPDFDIQDKNFIFS